MFIKYKCSNCYCEFTFTKPRKKCPNCSKNKLEENKDNNCSSNKVESKFINNFIDDLSTFKEDMEIDKKIGFKVSPREDRKTQLITVKCRVCKQDFETKFPTEIRCLKCSKGR